MRTHDIWCRFRDHFLSLDHTLVPGSPLAVDFGEQENVCSVTLVEVSAHSAARIREVPVPAAVPLRTSELTMPP